MRTLMDAEGQALRDFTPCCGYGFTKGYEFDREVIAKAKGKGKLYSGARWNTSLQPSRRDNDMKSELKAKLLRHLAAKKGNAGFTLIELLVVIIIIGILSAIALPSFLNQANKARQSEAKTYVGSINRGHQAYFLENNEFGPSISALGIGVKEGTENYTYNSAPLGEGEFAALTTANPENEALRQYIGGVQLTEVEVTDADGEVTSDEATTLAVLCEAVDAGSAEEGTAIGADDITNFGDALATAEIVCAGNTTAID